MGGAQRHALAHRQRRRLGRDGQLRHGDRLEVHLHACPIDRPVPHLQVDARGVTTRTLGNLGERHLEVDVVQPVVPDLAPAVVLLAHERLTVLRPREPVSREGRRVGGIKGQRAPIPLARNRHVRDDGRGRVQRDHMGQLLGDRRGATGGAFDGERVVAVRQLVALLVVAIKPGRAVERVFRPGDLPVASVGVGPALGRTPVRVGAHDLPGLVGVGVRQRDDVAQQHGTRGGIRSCVFVRRPGDDVQVTVIRTDGYILFRVEGVQLPESQSMEGHLRRADGFLTQHGAVEDWRVATRAVKAQVRNGEIGLSVRAREGHRAFNERTVGRLLGRERGELGPRVHGDGHRGAGGGGHGHRALGEGQIDSLARPVRRMPRIQDATDALGERLPTERVGVGGVGEVGQLHLECPPAGALAQLGLRPRRVRRAHDGRVHGRGRGRQRVHHAGTNPARGPVGPVLRAGIHDRVGGAHQEVGNQGAALLLAHRRGHRIGRQALTHEGRDASNLSRRLSRSV